MASEDKTELSKNDNLSKLVYALVPAEVTAAFFSLKSLAGIASNKNDIVFFILTIILGFLSFAYVVRLKGFPIWVGVINFAAFVLWASNIEMDRILKYASSNGCINELSTLQAPTSSQASLCFLADSFLIQGTTVILGMVILIVLGAKYRDEHK